MKLKRMSMKGQRWKKGHSCVSNPQNTKFREAAKVRFFQKVEGESNLTQEAVAQHDAALNNMSEQMEEMGLTPEDLQSAGKSCKTFATNFTTCSIPAFEGFFRNFKVSSEQQTRMLAIHAAAQEYLKEAEMPESPTSYFCALMASLEGIKDSEDDVSATLSLISKVMRTVDKDVLRSKFSDLTKALDGILTLYEESENGRLIMNALGSLSLLLRAQGKDQWSYSYTKNLLQKILAYTVHTKPRVRKSAFHNITAILTSSSFIVEEELSSNCHPAAVEVAEFCNMQLRASSEMGNTKATLHTLVFIRQVIKSFPKKYVKATCELILSAMQLGNVFINTCSMEAIYSLLLAKPSPEILPVRTNVALLNALTKGTSRAAGSLTAVIPSMNDSRQASAWITVISAAIMNLFRLDEEEGMKFASAWFVQLVRFWRSDHEEVHSKVFESFEAILEECIGKCSDETKQTENFQEQVTTLFEAVESGTSLQYQPAWMFAFKTIAICFTVLGPQFEDILLPCLQKLVGLLRDPNFPIRPVVEHCVGASVKSLGPKALMSVVPLEITGSISEDEKHFWVLPLLTRHVKNTSLTYFEDFFVHLAGKCFVILDTLKQKDLGKSVIYKAYQTVENQIWGMLPSFCTKAKDTEKALSNEKFARILCDHIKFRDDTRLYVLAALRHLIEDNVEHPGRLAVYARNYLPALFNVYLTRTKNHVVNAEDPVIDQCQRLAAYETIKVYLKIVPDVKRKEFMNLVMTKYDTETEDYRKKAFLDLARAFLPYMEVEVFEKYFNKIKPLLTMQKESKEQKAAYRLMEECLSIETEQSAEFVTKNLGVLREILLQSVASASPSSRAPRLRCIRQVLLNLKSDMEEEERDAFLQHIVAESVMCCKLSTAARKAAFALMADVGKTIQKHLQCTPGDTVRHSMKLFLAGLVGSPMLASNTIIAITYLTYEYKDIIPKDVLQLLIENMCVQLHCKARQIHASCLSFILMALNAFPIPVMSQYVNTIFNSLCKMDPESHRKLRRKVRDILSRLIRKFGYDRIKAMVPSNDHILLKRLRNLNKSDARKKKEREAKRAAGKTGSESDDEEFFKTVMPKSKDEILDEIESDNDNTDDEEESGKRNKSKKKSRREAWIKEDEDNIVDLLDPSAGQAVLTKRPKLKAKRGSKPGGTGGFEVDKKTGRIIINNDENNEENEEPEKMDFSGDQNEFLSMKKGASIGKIKNRKRMVNDTADDDAEPPHKIFMKSAKDKTKMFPKKNNYDYGSEFRAKKAKGDMMKKGKVLPFAYVQFSKERLNRRKKAKYEGQFKSIVRGSKKGVAKGSKQKNRSRK